MKEEDFIVECNVCKQRLHNWIGSTPCCGSLAFLVDENGQTKKEIKMYTNRGEVTLNFGK